MNRCFKAVGRGLAMAVALVWGVAGPATARDADAPNILFILADDLGYGDLGCYGNPDLDTPTLDALARDGVRFTQYYTPSPLCAPARAALLTGRYNHRTGAIDVSSNRGIDRIALSERTFGDYFRHAGYATALIGKWHSGLYCNDYLPHRRGFDLFYGFPNGEQDYWTWNLMRNGEYEPNDGRYLSDVLNDEAVRFIREPRDRPFALFLAHHAPHFPLQAPQPLIDKYVERLAGKANRSVAILYAMIEAMDAGLGRVIQALDETGLRDRTVIVFTSDNGAWMGMSPPPGESCERFAAGLSGTKGLVLEQGIRVPAIVSWPGTVPAGRVESTPVHGCDWLPTLFGLTGADAPAGAKPVDGADVMALLRGEPMPELSGRALPFQKNRYTPVAHSGAAIRRGPWKLYWPGEKTSMAKDIGRDNPSFRRGCAEPHWEMPIDPDLPSHKEVRTEPPKLFNLDDDPSESTDLAARHPDLARDLAAVYDAWFDGVSADWRRSFAEIVDHDAAYWRDRPIPDARALFKDYWQWKSAPRGVDLETADPLTVFRGYWNYEVNRREAAQPLIREKASPFETPPRAPAASDVTMRTLRFRPRNAKDPHDTFEAMDAFHATRLEWTYVEGAGGAAGVPEAEIGRIARVKASGRVFGGGSSSSQGLRASGASALPAVVDRSGHPVIQGHTREWATPMMSGCVNDPGHRAFHLRFVKDCVTAGATTMQRDEPSAQHNYAQAGSGCFCAHCMEGFRAWLKMNVPAAELAALGVADADSFDYRAHLNAIAAPPPSDAFDWSDPRTVRKIGGALHERFVEFQRDSTTEFFIWLRREVDAHNGGVPVGYSCNNTSFQKWDDPYIPVFDFAMSEMMMKSATPGHIYERAQVARSLGRLQVFGTPKTMGEPMPEPDLIRLKRRVIATAYAAGGLASVPWDLFMQSKDGTERYFGKPEDYADLYGMVRASHDVLDGYCTAGAVGPGFADDRFGGRFPVRVGPGGEHLAVVLRAIPCDETAPVVIHLVDWTPDAEATSSLWIEWSDRSFFPDGRLDVSLRRPAPYDRAAHDDAERRAQSMRRDGEPLGGAQSTEYAPLIETIELETRSNGDVTRCEIPAPAPWAMVIVRRR